MRRWLARERRSRGAVALWSAAALLLVAAILNVSVWFDLAALAWAGACVAYWVRVELRPWVRRVKGR